VAAHQQLTREWWEEERGKYELLVSPRVAEEARRGDPDAARHRLALLAELSMLEPSPSVDELASAIFEGLHVPDRAVGDALHLAYAMHYEVDYLLTWNCAHLANAATLKALALFAQESGLWLPIVCTPEALMPGREGEGDVP
jgi:predicted nucleic acid-binding protein